MTIKNTTEEYGNIAKFFHWVIAIAIFTALSIGFIMTYTSFNAENVYTIHKSIGVSIFILVALRLLWRLINPAPQLPTEQSGWQKVLAKLSHGLLYIMMICLPISGFIETSSAGYPITFFNLFTVPTPIAKNKTLATTFSQIHTYIAWCLLIFVIFHILAAFKHHFYDRDTVLKRMLPKKRISGG